MQHSIQYRFLLTLFISLGIILFLSCEDLIDTPPLQNTHDPNSNNFVPDIPTDILVVKKTDRAIEINWKNNSNYGVKAIIERKVEFEQFKVIGEVSTDSIRFVDTTGVLLGLHYIYRVGIVSSNGNISYSSEFPFQLSFNPPFQLVAFDSQRIFVSLNWIDSTSFEDGFIIEKSTESYNYQEIGRVDKNITSFIDVNVDTNFSYCYRVRAFTELNVSEPSDSIKVNFLPDVITRIEIPSPGETIQRFLFHPFGEILAVSEYWADAIKLYSVETGAYLRTLININTVFDFSPDGQLYAFANSGNIEIRDFSSGNLIHSISYNATSLKFTSDGRYLAAGSMDSSVTIWEIQTWTPVKTFESSSKIAISPDNKLLATNPRIGSEHFLRIWNISDGSLIRMIDQPLNVRFSFDASSQQLLCSDPNYLYVINISDGSIEFKSQPIAGVWYNLEGSPDGRIFAAGRSTGSVNIWRFLDYKLHWTKNISNYNNSTYYVGFNYDGAQMGTVNGDALRLWSLKYRWEQN